MCVQHIGGCSVHRGVSVHRRVFSTSEGIQYIGDTMSTLGGYHEYIGGVQAIGGCHEYIGGYHEY